MRIGFLVFNLDGMGGTSRSAITQANALVAAHGGRHDVVMVSVTRSADTPHYSLDDRLRVDYLVDVRDDHTPSSRGVPQDRARRWHRSPSLLVPARWDAQFTALCDVALERYLPQLEVDVLVTVTPGLLAAAEQLAVDSVALVHQEHRSSSDRVSGLEPLLTYGPRADTVALLTESTATWFAEQLGAASPPLVVLPNPLPQGFVPRSRLDQPVIVAAGRLMPEKQFVHLVRSFATIADRLPDWRLRIFGQGLTRNPLLAMVRKTGLYDRVELPGVSRDMPGEWAKASISALTSRAEGYPLVIQEAMAAGVPVVSYDCPSGPREIITHEVDGLLVTPGSEPALAAALWRLADDQDLRTRLGTAAARRAEAWDPAALASQWEQVFADALAHHAQSGVRRLARRHLLALEAGQRTGIADAGDPVARQAPLAVETGSTTPAQARRQALAVVAAAADAIEARWFALPPSRGTDAEVVVPAQWRSEFLGALAESSVPDYLSLLDPGDNGWPEHRGAVAESARRLASTMTPRLLVEPWPDGPSGPTILSQGCAVGVQFWDRSVDGKLVAPAPNPYLAEVSEDAPLVTTQVYGLEVPTLPLMSLPVIGATGLAIDVVYTWVDGADPVWVERQQQRLAQWAGTGHLRATSAGRARFESRDELRYSMRSLHLFAPWVRTVHVVTDGQLPAWLDPEHPKVKVVHHRDIMAPDALPTFNSHAIETALHRIPGLAEHFIYFNDDMMLGRPVDPEQFFDAAGRSSVFGSGHLVGAPADDVRRGDNLANLDAASALPAYITAALNNRALLAADFGRQLTHHLAHAPYPLRVSVLTEVSDRLSEAVQQTARTPFRSPSDISMVSSLAQHFGLLTGTAVEAAIDSAFVDLSTARVDRTLDLLTSRGHDVLCIGDHEEYAMEKTKVDALLADFLTGYYPIPAPWER